AKTAYTDNDNYSTATSNAVTGLPSIKPSLTYNDGATASTGPNNVSVTPGDVVAGDNQKWGSAVKSDNGTCFYIKDVATGTPGSGTFYGSSTVAACTGNQAFTSATSTTPSGGGW